MLITLKDTKTERILKIIYEALPLGELYHYLNLTSLKNTQLRTIQEIKLTMYKQANAPIESNTIRSGVFIEVHKR